MPFVVKILSMRINHQALRAIRERSEVPLTQLAERVDVTHGHLSNIEAGRRACSWGLLRKLAAELKVPTTAFLSCEPSEAPAAEDARVPAGDPRPARVAS